MTIGEPCVDAPGWRNFRGDSCHAYSIQQRCLDGHLLSDGGSIYGWPQRACCACGRALWLQSEAAHSLSAVRQAIFIATHAVDETDSIILRHYANSLKQLPEATLWLLLFAGSQDAGAKATEQYRWQLVHGLPVCVWGDDDVRRVYPTLHGSLERSARNGSLELLFRKQRTKAAYLQYYYVRATSPFAAAALAASPSLKPGLVMTGLRLDAHLCFSRSTSTLRCSFGMRRMGTRTRSCSTTGV